MDQFGNILNNATNQANQTYNTDTTNTTNAQNSANTQLGLANSDGQNVGQTAGQLDALGNKYSNMGNVTSMFNQDQNSQLNKMGFDRSILNQANQNVAQETGQLGAATNQMDAQGGTRGFNAVGDANRLANVQNQFGNAITANSKVQANELGQANAASTYTGQEIGAQQTSQGNAITAYNDSATQYNQQMANYANTLTTLSNQATTYGGLVGSNVASLMSAANSAATAHLAKYQAETQVTTQQLQRAQAGYQTAITTGQNIQNSYNTQLDSWKQTTQKLVTSNNTKVQKAISKLTASINGEKKQIKSTSLGSTWLPGLIARSWENNHINSQIAGQQSQIQLLNQQKLPNIM